MADYDPDNVFAKILRGDMPAHKVYEDDDTLAFMDVMPRGDGHVLVIPKAASRNMLDIDETVLGPLYATVAKIARAAKSALGAEGVVLGEPGDPVEEVGPAVVVEPLRRQPQRSRPQPAAYVVDEGARRPVGVEQDVDDRAGRTGSAHRAT